MEDGEKYLTQYLEFSSYYQFVDENRMLQIGNNLIKVFDEGVITAPICEEEKLLNVSSFFEPAQESFSYFENNQTDFVSEVKHEDGCDCTKVEIVARKTNEDNRTYVRFYREGEYNDYGFGGITYYMKIRPYKRILGVWYWCNRSIHYNVNYIVSSGYYGDGTHFGTLYGDYSGSCVNRSIFSDQMFIYRAFFLRLLGYASTPDARCNISCWVDD